MTDRSEWPAQMDAIAARIEFASRPLLLAEFADVFGEMSDHGRRNRVGAFTSRGWLVPHRKGMHEAARYTVGMRTWHTTKRVYRTREAQQPPEVEIARLQRLADYFERHARRLSGESRKHALDGARGARELADDVREDARQGAA